MTLWKALVPIPTTPPVYPARPVNGGPLDKAVAKSGRWAYEPKLNGWRALVHIPTGTMFNRKGERLSIEGEFSIALRSMYKSWTGSTLSTVCEWIDCEALERRHNIGRGTLYVLDVVMPGTYEERRNMVVKTFGGPLRYDCKPCDNYVHVPDAWGFHPINGETGMNCWEHLKQLNESWGCEFYEGMVAKRADSPYPRQRRNANLEFPYWMKHRWAF